MNTKNLGQVYLYQVTHPEYGTIEALAEDRLHAIYAASKAWGVPWTGIARACEVERLGPAPAEKPTAPKRPAAKKKGKSNEADPV